MKKENNASPRAGNIRSLRWLVVAAALGALTVFLGITRLGIIPWFSGASLSIMHIPVIIGAILEGPIVGMAIGAIFGVFSVIQANVSPGGIIDLAFRNPLVAVIPRVLFPLLTWLVFRVLSDLLAKIPGKLKYAAVPVSSLIGSLCHTALVLFALAAVVPAEGLLGGAADATVAGMLLAIFTANGVPEAIAAAVFVSIIVSIWTGVSSRKRSRVSDL